ncbi:hypothetical protein LZ30DRAFT_426326 [Colletotrichum cereale]|nr:hypothetical protein LZ30DRAFT_426326 [Colletotrichum cereale]
MLPIERRKRRSLLQSFCSICHNIPFLCRPRPRVSGSKSVKTNLLLFRKGIQVVLLLPHLEHSKQYWCRNDWFVLSPLISHDCLRPQTRVSGNHCARSRAFCIPALTARSAVVMGAPYQSSWNIWKRKKLWFRATDRGAEDIKDLWLQGLESCPARPEALP